MRNKILSFISIFFIGMITGTSVFYFYYQYKIPSDFEFMSKIPTFTQEQQSIIKKTICVISSNLENPEMFYVQNVTIRDTYITVDMYPLGVLQAGANSKGTLLVTAMGESKRFVFDKALSLEKIE